MNIMINGEVHALTSSTLQDILVEFNAQPPFAVALNGDFVSQGEYGSTQIAAGDQLDIVSPIYGG
ncbi:sulfur carrier protein ThiS [Algibacillus agarilyticus]|uniref:sulfur carrier protein ThiS n=1 Tax=Algibacillus agarilyticus TaxID=2234133 RepID=UPI000DCF6D3C|nr:sulfur carrier protein ThiS [Algibacillus agarilyticus]